MPEALLARLLHLKMPQEAHTVSLTRPSSLPDADRSASKVLADDLATADGSQNPSLANEPALAQASPTGWKNWLIFLVTFGRQRLAALGLTLVLGLGVAVLSLYAFAVLADEVMEAETLQVDNAVLATLRQMQSPSLDRAAWFMSAMGAEILAVLLVVIVGVLGWQRRWGGAVSLLVTVGGAQLLNNVLKDWFHRTRPAPVDALIPAQAFSFPSGHAMVSAAFYLFIGYLAWRLLSGRTRIVVSTLLVLIALLIGLARLYLGVHYLTDVVAGYIAGIAWTETVIIGGHFLSLRTRRRGVTLPEPALAHTGTEHTSEIRGGLRDAVDTSRTAGR
jgi:undecaprenyl-diphosphatase